MKYMNFNSFVNDIINRIEIKLRNTHLISKPVEMSIEPTLQCNSNCIMCNRNFNRKETKYAEGFLSWDILMKAKPFIRYAKQISFGGFGEALLHPEYIAMLKEIKKTNPFVYFFTNGALMTDEIGRGLVDGRMDMIYVSIGGATRETYKNIRGIDAFEEVVNNIMLITKYKRKSGKKRPILAFNVVAMKSLLPELESLVKLAYDIGVEHIAFPNLVVQGPEIKEESLWLNIEHSEKAFRNANLLAVKLGIEFRPPNLRICELDCKNFFRRISINWDGTVRSCAPERYLIGDLKKDSIDSIWNSNGMIKLRKDYYEKGLKIVCPNCSCWDNRPETFLNPWINARERAKVIS